MCHACLPHMPRDRVTLSDGSVRVVGRRYFLRMGLVYCANAYGEDPVVAGLLWQLRRFARSHRYAIHAYCFVPKQAVLLLEGHVDSSPLRRFIRDWKHRTTLDHRWATGLDLWQRGHVDQMLSPGESTHEVARYVVETAVRDGFVATASEHRYSGSDVADTVDALQRAAHRPPSRMVQPARRMLRFG